MTAGRHARAIVRTSPGVGRREIPKPLQCPQMSPFVGDRHVIRRVITRGNQSATAHQAVASFRKNVAHTLRTSVATSACTGRFFAARCAFHHDAHREIDELIMRAGRPDEAVIFHSLLRAPFRRRLARSTKAAARSSDCTTRRRRSTDLMPNRVIVA